MNFSTKILAGLLACVVLLSTRESRADRLVDLCDVVGVRENQLVGYGVVTGLSGTGDDVSAPFAMQSLRALLRRLGVQIDQSQLRLRNVAAVIVTGSLPPFARSGAKLDVTVSSIGNARSLRGGVLVQTPLRGADRRTYAVAQGSLIVGGFSASGSSGSSTQSGTTNTARIPNGALVEREIKSVIGEKGEVLLALKAPDFITAQRVAEAVNKSLGENAARAVDGGAIKVTTPQKFKEEPVMLMAQLNELEVQPATVARVVINERTGTVVAGGDVRLLPVAIAQGGITINVRETPIASQPEPFSRGGTTAVLPDSDIQTHESAPAVTYVNGATSLADVAQALSTFGVSPRELASILQALKAAGALRAEIVVQ